MAEDLMAKFRARKIIKAEFGKAELAAVPLFEDALWYKESDLVELYWLSEEVYNEPDVEKRAALIEKFSEKTRSIKKLPNAPERTYLWPEGKIPCLTTDYVDNSDYMRNHDPDFVPYFHEMLVPETVTPKGMVVVCAGGDHGYASLYEGYQTCKDFVSRGYQTLFLANRTNACPWLPVDAAADCSRAIRMARMNAEKYRISPDKVAFAGFSNGGVTGENIIQFFSGEQKMTDHYPDYVPDGVDEYYGSPDAYICVYGPRWAGYEFNFDVVKYPPTFFAVGREDGAMDNLNYVYPQLTSRGIPVEVHTFAGTPHGKAGIEIVDGKVNYPNFQLWLDLVDHFLMDLWK